MVGSRTRNGYWSLFICPEKEAQMQTKASHVPTSILRVNQVRERTGLSRSTLYQRVKEGKFPQPITLGPRCVGWISTAVDDWIQQTIAGSSWPLPAPARKPAAKSWPQSKAALRPTRSSAEKAADGKPQVSTDSAGRAAGGSQRPGYGTGPGPQYDLNFDFESGESRERPTRTRRSPAMSQAHK